ncbi:MAG TPA: cytochrome P450 [Solirubrobacteraceae bacterium]|jgi:cytochrome P450|nr:cytochrome P450 [Solirubrobacteraceae bacterium]
MASAAGTLPAVKDHAATSLPPGPRWPAAVQTAAWAVALPRVLDHCRDRYGEMFTMRFFPSGRRIVVVSGKELAKQVFTASPEVAPSAAGVSPIAPVMGPSSVLTLTGPEHIRQRRLLLPPFHGERMREYEETIVDATRRDLEDWPLGVAMTLQERTRAITLEVILRAVFGVEAERMDAMREALGALFMPLTVPMVLRIALTRSTPGRPTGAFGRALDHLDTVMYAELERRRTQEDLAERKDILSLLLQARDEQGEAMSDAELRDELVTLLLAGHETTATSVAWAIERLVRHPDKLARLAEEIDAGESEEYMGGVIHETMRVRPVVPLVVRILKQPLRVGGHTLPAGTRVAPAIWLTNRDAREYEAPTEFRPERWEGRQPETFSWIPFGGGIRRCIGASFALLEMKLMLRTILAELQPQLPPAPRRGPLPAAAGARSWAGGERIRRRAITLVPGDGARVVWTRRAA